MLFSADQLRRVREIIRRYHSAVGISVFGPAASPGDVDKLREALIDADAPNLIEDSYDYAGLLARTGDYGLMTKPPAEIVRMLEAAGKTSLSRAERAAVDQAARHAGQYMTGLGDRVTASVMGAITGEESNRVDQAQEIVASETAKNRAKRETVSALKKQLRDKLPDHERDFQRLAATETNNAIQEGAAATIAKKGEDPNVSKIPGPGACPDCLRLYTDGGSPIVFKLSELQANGSNVGRKRRSWLAVVEALHPWCACQLVALPKGMVWDGNELVPDEAAKSLTGSPYKLAYRTDFQGIPISVENRKGSYRHWEDETTGESGKTKQVFPYGYIRGVEGKDGDEIDVYLGPGKKALHAYVVHQRIKDGGRFHGHDEDKIMLGFGSRAEAKAAYLKNFDDPRFFGSMTTVPMDKFRRIVEKNKGKRLVLWKSEPALSADDLQKAPFFRDAYDIKIRGMRLGAKPDRYLSFVQGTDDSPRPTRPADLTGQADEMGLTVKGKKKRKKEKEKRNKDRSAQAKIKRESLDVFDLMRRPTGQDNEVATAKDYVPQTLKDLRAEMHRLSMKDNHKVQLILDERRRRSGNRVSEAETMKHFRDKSNKERPDE